MAFVTPILPLRPARTVITATPGALPTFRFSTPCKMTLSRRSLLSNLAALATASTGASLLPPPIRAAMYSTDTEPSFKTTGNPNQLSTYMPQIEAGYNTLIYLRNNWVDKTSAYDGDVVRRDLGTVGVKSPLFGLRKVLFKAWQTVADSSQDDALIDRLDTEQNDVINAISSVDFQLYSVSFTDLRESKESLLTQGRAALDDLISIYSQMLDDFHSVL